MSVRPRITQLNFPEARGEQIVSVLADLIPVGEVGKEIDRLYSQRQREGLTHENESILRLLSARLNAILRN